MQIIKHKCLVLVGYASLIMTKGKKNISQHYRCRSIIAFNKIHNFNNVLPQRCISTTRRLTWLAYCTLIETHSDYLHIV